MWGELLTGIGSLAGTAYSIYNAEQANSTASQHYESASEAAKQQIGLAKDQWERYKKVFGPLEAEQVKEALRDIELYRPFKNEMLNEMKRNVEMYRPIEDKMVDEAQKTGAEWGQEFADRASADIAQGFDKSREVNLRNLSRMGINPNSGKFASQNSALQKARALGEAGGRTEAFSKGRDTAWNRKAGALGYRRGLPIPQQSTASGNSALSSAMRGLSSGTNAMGNLAGVAANASGQNAKSAGYLFGKGMDALGGVDWGKIGNSISGMFGSSGGSGNNGSASFGNMSISV